MNTQIPTGYKHLPNALVLSKQDSDVYRVVGRTTLGELRYDYNVTRPSVLERNKDDRCHPVREIIQRKFVGERVKNRDQFSSYIKELKVGRPGALPPLTLYSSDPLHVDVDGNVYIKRTSCIVAIDGETQLDALWAVGEEGGEEDAIWDHPLAYTLHAGIAEDIVRVIVHDLNALGRSIKEQEVASLNAQSPINQAIERGLEKAGKTMEDIDRSGDGLGTKYAEKVTSFVRLVNLAAGIHGGVDRIHERTESFLVAFKHPATANGLDSQRIAEAVAAYCRLGRDQRKELGKTESKILGALASRDGMEVIDDIRVGTFLRNKRKLKGRRMSPRKKLDALGNDLR